MTARRYDVIGFDADDTLWHSEDTFHETEQRFVEMISPYVEEGTDLRLALRETEQRHLPVSGYGVKAFTLSMVECAVRQSGGRVPSSVVGDLVAVGLGMLTGPVRLIDGAPDVLSELGGDHRLVLITKGDLIHQYRKLEQSGLAEHFAHVDVVMEKDEATYRRVLRDVEVDPGRFCMIGNSVRSDVLPVLAIGGAAIHIEYHYTWDHERVDHDGTVVTADTLGDVISLVRAAL